MDLHDQTEIEGELNAFRRAARPKSSVPEASTIYGSDAGFERDVAQSEQPVPVDFWAEWCGPRRAIGFLVDELAHERSGSLRVVKVNIDDHTVTAQKLGVRGIPTLILYKGGSVVAQKVGALGRSELAAFVNQAL